MVNKPYALPFYLITAAITERPQKHTLSLEVNLSPLQRLRVEHTVPH